MHSVLTLHLGSLGGLCAANLPAEPRHSSTVWCTTCVLGLCCTSLRIYTCRDLVYTSYGCASSPNARGVFCISFVYKRAALHMLTLLRVHTLLACSRVN